VPERRLALKTATKLLQQRSQLRLQRSHLIRRHSHISRHARQETHRLDLLENSIHNSAVVLEPSQSPRGNGFQPVVFRVSGGLSGIPSRDLALTPAAAWVIFAARFNGSVGESGMDRTSGEPRGLQARCFPVLRLFFPVFPGSFDPRRRTFAQAEKVTVTLAS
jgi:hypothetical protein